MAKKAIIKGHGLRGEDLEEVKNAQINDAQENTETGNVDSSYKFPAHESHLVHAAVETESWEQGRKTSVPKIQTYDPRVFKTQEANGGFAGYAVTILHNPDKIVKVDEIERVYVEKGKGKGEANADLVGGVGADTSAALTSMNATQLKSKYKEVFGKEAPKSLDSDAKLIDEISARLKYDQEQLGNDGSIGK